MTISQAARAITGPRKGSPWTDAEIAILCDMRRAGHGAPAIAQRLGRTVGAVYAEAKKAGSLVMVRKPWTEAETSRLRALYMQGYSEALIAEKLERTPASVRARVDLLRLSTEMRRTETQDGFPAKKRKVRIFRPAAPARREHVPGANGSWSRDQMAALEALSGKATLQEAAARIGRPLSGVRAKAKHLGVTFLLPRKDTSERDKQLVEMWEAAERAGGVDIEVVAAAIGVSTSTVLVRSRDLGLRKARSRRRFDSHARAEIVRLAEAMTASGIARATGWDLRTVRRVGQEENIVFADPAPRRRSIKGAVDKGVGKKTPVQPKESRPPAAKAPRKPHDGRQASISTTTRSKAAANPVCTGGRSVSVNAAPGPVPPQKRSEIRREPSRAIDVRAKGVAAAPIAPTRDKGPANDPKGRGSPERLEMMRKVLSRMKKQGYFQAQAGLAKE